MTAPEAVRLEGISKTFFGVPANLGVDLSVAEGEIHALLGENGAGKSTACSILAGLYQPDAGEIYVGGQPVRFSSPSDALAAGVGMVYQHFRLVEQLTVAENVVLGSPGVPLRLRRRWLFDTCRDVGERFRLDLDPAAIVGELSVGEQQRVELARLLYRGVRVLILDEPTAVLTPRETAGLFDNVRALAAEGHAFVIVTHKLTEVLSVADTVTVMRAGRVVANGPAESHTAGSLARAMVNRRVDEVVVTSREVPQPGGGGHDRDRRDVLRVERLTVAGAFRSTAVDDVSFTVGRGEILGVCGVSGNGQRELADAVAGMRPARSGAVWLNGRDIVAESVAVRIALGVSYIPEDRLATGVAAGLSVEDNLLLRMYRDPGIRRGPLLDYDRAISEAQGLIDRFDVRGVRRGAPVSALSGGNIQRVILAREISRRPSLVIAASPTRGLDVHATMAVRRVLADARGEGLAVLLISEDLNELLAMSDRLIVMYHGRVVGAFANGEAPIDVVGELMAGVGVEAG